MESGLLETIVTVLGTLAGIYVKDYLDKRKRKDKGVEQDLIIHKTLSTILDEVRMELNAGKTHYWVFSNGDVTFSGYHLKKLSILEESSNENVDTVAQYFQLIPAKSFEKHLQKLNESEDGTLILDVNNMSDDLKDLYSLYDVKKVLKVKVKDSRGRWIGILSAWYFTDEPVNDGQIAFAKLQASRIGAIK